MIITQKKDKKKILCVKNSKLFLSDQEYNMTTFQDITHKYELHEEKVKNQTLKVLYKSITRKII